MYFHYGRRDAWLLIGQDLYHLAEPPRHAGGALVWDRTIGGRHIVVRIKCAR